MTRPARQGEGQLSDAIREALAWEPGLLLFRNSAGVVKSRGRLYHAGLGNGSADLVGVLAVAHETPGGMGRIGRFVALEIKTEDGKVEPHQEAWLQGVRERGGFAAVVRSPLQALAAIRRARNGASE